MQTMKPTNRHLLVLATCSAVCVSLSCGKPGFEPNEETGTGGSSPSATGGNGSQTGGATSQTGGNGSQTGGATSQTGGSGSQTGGASSETGGSHSIPVGVGGQASGGAIGTGGDLCATVGCAPAPLCTEGCTAQCGCCPCAEGEATDIDGVKHVCVGGCWAPVDGACEYLGVSYSVGATFPAGDGCNECDCLADGTVSCTAMACPPCDPEAEIHMRSYVSEDPEMCMLINFTCPENTTVFGNDCGCGCEQSPTCPEWFNCMPTTNEEEPCDEEAIRIKCPYSGIAY